MEEILITGCAGNIGSSLCQFLVQKRGYKIIGADNLTTGKTENLKKVFDKITFYEIDCNDISSLTKVFAKHEFKYIFHYAALAGVEKTLSEPLNVFKDLKGIQNICQLAIANKVSKIFYSSSSEVYGDPYTVPLNEDKSPINPKLPYAMVKAVGESMIKTYAEEYGLNYTIFRFFNTYGPNQSRNYVLMDFIIRALKGEDIKIYGDGSQTRSFLHVNDNLNVALAIMQSNLFDREVINIGSDIEVTISDLANMIIEITGSKSKITHYPPREKGDMRRRVADISKLRNQYDKRFIELREGIISIISEVKKEKSFGI